MERTKRDGIVYRRKQTQGYNGKPKNRAGRLQNDRKISIKKRREIRNDQIVQPLKKMRKHNIGDKI